MKQLIILVAAMLFTASVSAESVYNGLAEDNPDLRGKGPTPEEPMGEPGPDPAADVYGEIDDGNPDLHSDIETTKTPIDEEADIYGEIGEDNPDLRSDVEMGTTPTD